MCPTSCSTAGVLVPGPADVDTYVLALDQAVFPPTPSPADNPRLLN